jgi:serine/threonine-protein kinase RsbW
LIAGQPNVRLSLSNRSENVMLVREVLTGVAEAVGVDPNDLNDIRTAVTEACNNVVVHAYDGAEGPLEIEVYLSPSAIEVVVRDHGTGIRPHIGGEEDEGSSGIGLLVIQALVQRVAFTAASERSVRAGWDGTEVRMAFATPGLRSLEVLQNGSYEEFESAELCDTEPARLAITSVIEVAPSGLARTVLPRLLCALAARAQFSTDRISDAQLIADALATHAFQSIGGGHLSLAVRVEPRDLELRIAPLRSGSASVLLVDSAVGGLGPVIEKLTDNHKIAPIGSSEVLALRMVDRR